MKAKIKELALVILSVFILAACESDDPKAEIRLDGTYSGTFFRTLDEEEFETSTVTLVFTGNAFEGESSIIKYPAICRGTYAIHGLEIEFVNTCAWTAEFDWSYILSGRFTFTRNGNEITLVRNYGGGGFDTYVLMKQ
jgi:hypothetical protein